jgi:autotransporter-associated beta strand protein
MKKLYGIILSAVAAGATCTAAHGADITIDFGTQTGPVKPMHAAGQGPLCGGPDFSMFRYLGFEKTGAGTLVLTGNLKGLSGTVKVSEGTLSLPCESRCRTFMLDVAEGATVTHAPPPGLMLFVR